MSRRHRAVAPLRTGQHVRGMSSASVNRLRDSLGWWIESAPRKQFYSKKDAKNFHFKLNFITLTLPSKQCHSDKQITNELLKLFLNHLRKVWSCQNYVWRAEKQFNGNIHYHIMSDVFIHHSDLRRVWNGILNKLGYIDRYKGSNPNSTDVHAIKTGSEATAYLCKYFSKKFSSKIKKKIIDHCKSEGMSQKQERKYKVTMWNRLRVKGRNWGMSYHISAMRGFTVEESNAVFDSLSNVHRKETDHAILYYVRASELSGRLGQYAKSYTRMIRKALIVDNWHFLREFNTSLVAGSPP